MTVTDRQPLALVRSDLDRALAFLGQLPWPMAYGQGPALTVTFANAAWTALRPRAADAPLDAWVAGFGATAAQSLERALATREPTWAREVEATDDGADAPLLVDLLFAPVRTVGVEDDGVLVSAQPVTEAVHGRRRAEEAHQAALLAADRLRLALASADLGIFDWEVDSGRMQVDARCLALFGLRPDQVLDRETFWSAVHPDDRETVRAAIEGALDPDGDHHYEVDYRVVDNGDTRWLQGRGRAFFFQGRPLRFLGTLLDVTERRLAQIRQAELADEAARAQREAEQAHRRLTLLAEAGEVLSGSLEWDLTLGNVISLTMPALADFGFFDVVEPDGQVRRVARAHEDPRRQAILEPTQWARSERTDMNLCALSAGESAVHPDIDDAWLRAVAVGPEHLAVMRDLAFCSMLTVPLRHRGRLLGALTLFYADSGRRHGPEDQTLAEELARRAAVAVDNARLMREAREAIAQRDDFLTIASHELRTPLATLRLGADALMRQVRAGGARALEPRVDMLQRQLRRLEALVGDLLDVERLEADQMALELEPLELGAVVRDVLAQLADAAAAAECAVTATIEDGLVGRWDRARVEQIVGNLMGNALKYGRGRPIDVAVRAAGGAARLEVRDHGIGLDAEQTERIFGRFERAVSTRHYGGFGLGLWICRQLVERLGGTIRAEGAPGQGALFTVDLPLEGPSLAATDAPA